MDFQSRSHHYHVSVHALLAVAVLLVWWFAWPGGAVETEPAQGWNATAKKFHWTIRGMQGQVATSAHRATHLAMDNTGLLWTLKVQRVQSESLARWADSVHETTHDQALAPAVRRLGEACGEVLNNCEQRVAEWQQRDSLHFAMYQLAAPRLATADSIIAAGLKAGQCRWLFVKCPSRTRALEVGLVLGVLGTLVVAH